MWTVGFVNGDVRCVHGHWLERGLLLGPGPGLVSAELAIEIASVVGPIDVLEFDTGGCCSAGAVPIDCGGRHIGYY